MIIEKLISGGQSGVDIAAWDAAKKFGIETGGWLPRGFRTEYGPRPHYAVLYGARETESSEYPTRTRLNVYESDALAWFGDAHSRGGRLTLDLASQANIPVIVIPWVGARHKITPHQLAWWIGQRPADKTVILVAGNRESIAPGIGAWVEGFMAEVFALMTQDVKS